MSFTKVYRAPSAGRKREDGGIDGEGGDEEEDSKLLSVSAGCNVLSLVMRDEGIMKFVKYVSANAPGSRYLTYSISYVASSIWCLMKQYYYFCAKMGRCDGVSDCFRQ